MSLALACTLHAQWLEESPQWAESPGHLGFSHVQWIAAWDQPEEFRPRVLALLEKFPVGEAASGNSLWLKPHPEREIRLEEDELRRLLDRMAQRQWHSLVLPAGVLPGWQVLEQEASARQWSPAAEAALARLERLFADSAATVLLDVAHPATENPKATAQALGRWGHPRVRLWLDLGAQALRFPYSQVEVAMQRWFGILGGVALRDAVPEMPLEWTPSPGQGGEIDFARCWQILSTGAFGGLASVVQGRRRGRKRRLSPEQWEQELREGLEHLHYCGWPVPG